MLDAGTLLGPYKILEPIGAGGMGEVYRALDTRLERQVAVKVLSPTVSNDADAMRRFEQEARAASLINHPNILSIYDVGGEGMQRYIVSELLEGQSLRARLREGAIPPRKATDYAVQIARGLAAAHDKGIIHRDLKPENLFLTRDGQMKILDFGLVKLMAPRLPGANPADDHATTAPTAPTEPGRMLGTVGYMSPEQIRGGGGDHRSDVFSFGAILYEMLTGRPAFRGDSPIETLNAILKEDPPDFSELGVRVPSALERSILHCLEKNPEERFQSARDIAFDLGALSGLTSQVVVPHALWPRMRWRSTIRPLAATLLIALALAGAYVAGTRHGLRPPPAFHRMTFRSGTIYNARFGPDGQTVYYGARLGGNPVRMFAVRSDSPESRDLGLGSAEILAVSSTGQLAISLRRRPVGYVRESGTLAQVPIAGGAPRELLEDVEAADWTPDGRGLAIIRTVSGRSRLEYPIGKVLFESGGWISHPRFNPRGDAIAFLDHPIPNDDRGTVSLIDLGKPTQRKSLTAEWSSLEGVAWSPDGHDVWFAGERPASARSINAVSRDGNVRLIAGSAGALWLQDISKDGRVLATREDLRSGIAAIIPGETRERDLSWLDFSIVRDLSADGKTIAFSESGEAGGSIFGVYVRSVDGSPAVRLGEGTTEALSPDGRWVLSIPRNRKPAQIVMLPTGPGQPRAITSDAIDHRTARWFPDGRRIMFQGSAANAPSRVWVQPVDGGAPRPVTPEGVSARLVTPDGTRILGFAPDRRFYFYPVDGGAPEPLPALRTGDLPVRFANDDRSLYVGSFGRVPALLYRVDLKSGTRTVVREASPSTADGVSNVGPILTTADGATAVYSYTRLLSDLYVVDTH
ncbi:MAG: protein kinase [Acidobacteriota bacterium]